MRNTKCANTQTSIAFRAMMTDADKQINYSIKITAKMAYFVRFCLFPFFPETLKFQSVSIARTAMFACIYLGVCIFLESVRNANELS